MNDKRTRTPAKRTIWAEFRRQILEVLTFPVTWAFLLNVALVPFSLGKAGGFLDLENELLITFIFTVIAASAGIFSSIHKRTAAISNTEAAGLNPIIMMALVYLICLGLANLNPTIRFLSEYLDVLRMVMITSASFLSATSIMYLSMTAKFRWIFITS